MLNILYLINCTTDLVTIQVAENYFLILSVNFFYLMHINSLLIYVLNSCVIATSNSDPIIV